MPDNRPTEIFLSHAGQDRAFAREVAEALRRHGVPVWYSETEIQGGQRWHDEIGAALERCDWFLLVLSPAAVESMWVKREVLYALEEARFEDKILLLNHKPCMVRKLSWVLPQYQYIDFRADIEDGYRELLRTWGVGFRGEV